MANHIMHQVQRKGNFLFLLLFTLHLQGQDNISCSYEILPDSVLVMLKNKKFDIIVNINQIPKEYKNTLGFLVGERFLIKNRKQNLNKRIYDYRVINFICKSEKLLIFSYTIDRGKFHSEYSFIFIKHKNLNIIEFWNTFYLFNNINDFINYDNNRKWNYFYINKNTNKW